MNQFQKIKQDAEEDFNKFLEYLHEEYPELIFKYQITTEMKHEFIEALVAQYWESKTVDLIRTVELTVNRYKSLNI